MERKDTRLYNVIFPIWMLAIIPVTWLVVLPANFVIDLLVTRFGMKRAGLEDRKARAKKAILKVWVCGFLADAVGGAMMFLFSFLDILGDSWSDFYYRVCYDPFSSVSSFLWVAVCTAVSALLIYALNNGFALKKAIPEEDARRKVALILAVVTAPWLFFLPTAWFF